MKIQNSIKTYKTTHYEITYNQVIKGCPKKHFHETLTMGALEKGELEVSVKKDFLLSVNSLLCINPYEIHSIPRVSMKNENLYVLYLDKTWLEGLQKELLNVESYLPLETLISNQTLYETFIKLCKLMLSNAFVMQKEEQLLLFLQTLLTQQTKQELPVNSETLANDIRAFIDEDKIFELTLEDIAKNFHIGTFHLIRLFKKSFGMTPYQYILSQKLNWAKELLLQGENIAMVALHCGFSDQSHLYKYFKEVFGTSPKAYQNSLM